MDHQDFSVVLVNEQGEVTGSKARREVDKEKDIVHCVDVLVFDGDRLLVSVIPARPGQIYPNQLANAPATMLRVDETTEEAGRRCLQKEVGIEGGELHLLGQHFFVYDDGVKRFKTAYWMNHVGPLTLNPDDVSDIHWMTRGEIEELMIEDPAIMAPVFKGVWDIYADQLPF